MPTMEDEQRETGLTFEGQPVTQRPDSKYFGTEKVPFLFTVGQIMRAQCSQVVLLMQALDGDEVTTDVPILLQTAHLMKFGARDRLIKRGSGCNE